MDEIFFKIIIILFREIDIKSQVSKMAKYRRLGVKRISPFVKNRYIPNVSEKFVERQTLVWCFTNAMETFGACGGYLFFTKVVLSDALQLLKGFICPEIVH